MNKIILAALCLFAVGVGAWLSNSLKPEQTLEITGFAFPDPVKLSDITLVNHENQPLNSDSFLKKWTFIYVGYTFCPDACPMTLAILNQLDTILTKNKVDEPVEMMLVSVDPERDTTDKLNSYVKHFNPSFTAATGTAEEIQAFTKQVSAIYVIPEDRSDPNYIVDHSSSVILIDPNAAVHAIFTPPQQASDLADDFVKLSRRYNNAS